jgi:hypothetical protein
MTKDYKKWIIMAPFGLLLTGLGIVVILEAFHLKNTETSFTKWFILGTLGLIIFNSGLSIFGQSIIHKTKDEILKEKR